MRTSSAPTSGLPEFAAPNLNEGKPQSPRVQFAANGPLAQTHRTVWQATVQCLVMHKRTPREWCLGEDHRWLSMGPENHLRPLVPQTSSRLTTVWRG
jgi:hypothetical protein